MPQLCFSPPSLFGLFLWARHSHSCFNMLKLYQFCLLYLYHSPLSQASDGLVLRRMMTLGHGGLAKHYSNPQRLDRRDNLFRYEPACVFEAVMLISDKISRLGWRYFASYFVAFQNVFSPPPPLIGRVLDSLSPVGRGFEPGRTQPFVAVQMFALLRTFAPKSSNVQNL